MISLLRIIARQVHAEIMHAIHTFMHHELHRQRGTFARLESHRTDGRSWRSASLHDFDVGLFDKPQCFIAYVGELERDLNSLV